MGTEKHVLYTACATTEQVLFALVQFIRDSGQTTLRFSNDAGTDAIWTGSAFANAADVTSSASFGAGAGGYMVIEPVTAMPGGERWQALIKGDDGGANKLTITTACTKSSYTQKWTNGAAAFNAAQIKTGAALWNASADLGANFRACMSTSDLDTYDVHQFDGGAQTIVGYTYFRVLLNDPTTTENSKFLMSFRVGGYRPMEPHADLNPWCMLTRVPQIASAVSAPTWGSNYTTTNNLNRAPLEDAQTTLDLTSTGYAKIIGMNYATGTEQLTRGGKWASMPIFLVGMTGGDILGSFGKYDMMSGNLDRSDGSVDSTNSYMNLNDLHIRWKP